jgi:hypothetical protein
MKTSPTIESVIGSAAARILVPAIVIGSLMAPAIAAAQADAKTHTLFMGADVSVGMDRQLYAVRDVSGSSWVIDAGGRTRVISASGGPIEVKVTPSLKITEVSATISGLAGTPAFALRSSPSAALARALVKAAQDNAGYSAAVNEAQATVVQAQNLAQYTTATNNTHGPMIQSYSMGSSSSSAQASRVENELEQTLGSAGADLEMVGDRGLAHGYDAMDVAFTVSCEHRLDRPYVVTITQYRRRDAGSAGAQRLIYARALDPIGSQPTSVHFLEEGFPPAFELQKFEVHLYNQGAEVATSVSPRRVELTRDEAFDYVRTAYIGAHRGETLPAAPLMGKLPASLPARLAGGQYSGTFYVKVSKDGLASEAFLDPACTRSAGDPYLESVVRCIRFKPALSQGQPTDGVAALDLARLAI